MLDGGDAPFVAQSFLLKEESVSASLRTARGRGGASAGK